ncbi:hypothetical protein [Rufibacter latericius]|uniref:DUF922 domain-containing protein n=1 Tax=Rufibacter latericius TaxID=2487040 RepID=A0A3M9N1B9_9BACT|nr:hypothetical protein [Rufibacter latericius]RNI31147.1 hypothetical protein EFB08_01010 [Rufibacter latericius]
MNLHSSAPLFFRGKPIASASQWLLLLGLSLLALLVLGGAGQSTAKQETLVLKSEQLPFQTKEFYIADVIDERQNPKAMGSLVAAVTPASVSKPVDFQGGSVPAIKKYINESFSHNPKARPILMRLKEYQVTEKTVAGGRVEGQIQISAAFEVQREGKKLHLFDYKSGARYARPATNLTMVEPTLRKTLSESLRYLTGWMDKEVPHNEKLARKIQVHFEDYKQHSDDDTLFYDPARPLNWSDFQGGSSLRGNYAASIFPGLSNDIQSTVENGVIHIRVATKPYILRSLSKVLPDARNEYALNHEQRHFDILKLVSEHYKQRLRPEKLNLEDYESIIRYQYLEALWELDRLQKQYDGETSHGLNRMAQEKWNQKIDQELREFKVKP